MRRTLFCLAAFFSILIAKGEIEEVYVAKVLKDGDSGIIERRNGERWYIEKSSGASSFWKYEGKKAFIDSPGRFCGSGARILLPEHDQDARIISAYSLDSSTVVSPTGVNAADIRLVFSALAMLGCYEPNGSDQSKKDFKAVLAAFQKTNGIKESLDVSPELLIALSRGVTGLKPATPEAVELSQQLLESAKRLMSTRRSGRGAAISDVGEVIESQVDGDFEGWEGETVIKLTNGQIWQQSEYRYSYHYSYMPKVYVIKTPSGYQMRVDGMSDSVRVVLLKR